MTEELWTPARKATLKKLVLQGIERAKMPRMLGLPSDFPIPRIQNAIERFTTKADRLQGSRLRATQNSHAGMTPGQKAHLQAETKPAGHPVTWGAFMGDIPFPGRQWG